jgi:tetratricopeptide (TPR) repeat protein
MCLLRTASFCSISPSISCVLDFWMMRYRWSPPRLQTQPLGLSLCCCICRPRSSTGSVALNESAAVRERARHADPAYVFPRRLEELVLLSKAVQADPGDAHAPYYLGNLLYDRRRYSEAIQMWERSVALEPSFATPWRNLGIGYFNVLQDSVRALQAFSQSPRHCALRCTHPV